MNTPLDGSARIDRLVQRRERNPRTHTFAELADLYRQAGELGVALEVIEDGLEHHPHFLNARLVHARLLRDLGRPEDAARAFELVLDIDSENEIARDALAELGRGVTDINVARAETRAARTRSGAAQWLAGLDADWRNGVDAEPDGARADAVGASDEDTATGDPGPDQGDAVDEGITNETDDGGPTTGADVGDEGRDPDRRAGDDLETATLANLYVSQGLIEQAVGIYERLLARDPYNARLAASLEEVRRRGKGPVRREEPARPPHPVVDAEPVPDSDSAGAPDGVDPGVVAEAPDEEATAPASDPPIGEFLGALLEGRAPVEPGADRPIDWPEWLRDLGRRE